MYWLAVAQTNPSQSYLAVRPGFGFGAFRRAEPLLLVVVGVRFDDDGAADGSPKLEQRSSRLR